MSAKPELKADETSEARDPLRRVLVALDLSIVSGRVVSRATRLPLAENARLELLHVLSPEMPRRLLAQARHESTEMLGRLRRTLEGAVPSASIACTVSEGRPFVEIIRRSRALGAELTVLGGEREAQSGRGFGSTSKRVIRKGDTAVLVVRIEAKEPYCRPLVAVDLSDVSRRVVDLALRVVTREGLRRARLVHAYHVPFEGWLRETGGTNGDIRKSAAVDFTRFQRSLSHETRGWRPILRKGDARIIILTEAVLRRADVIVLGTHGRSGLSNALLGSVAEWIVAESPCDVLITRPTPYSFELP